MVILRDKQYLCDTGVWHQQYTRCKIVSSCNISTRVEHADYAHHPTKYPLTTYLKSIKTSWGRQNITCCESSLFLLLFSKRNNSIDSYNTDPSRRSWQDVAVALSKNPLDIKITLCIRMTTRADTCESENHVRTPKWTGRLVRSSLDVSVVSM